jgi:hypothetical protein
MTTSGTTTFFSSIQAADVIQDAFERCGIDFSKVSGNQLDSARRSIQFCFSDFGNKGPNLWRVVQRTTALAVGQNTITLATDVIEVLQAYITDSSVSPPINYVVSAISRSDFAALPYPTQAGDRPTQYYFDRQSTPIVNLWPVQSNTTKTFGYFAWTFQQDVGGLQNQLDIPNRWYEALTSNLGWRLAMKFAPDRYAMLKENADQAFNAAAAEDVESVPLRIVPNLYGGRWQ